MAGTWDAAEKQRELIFGQSFQASIIFVGQIAIRATANRLHQGKVV